MLSDRLLRSLASYEIIKETGENQRMVHIPPLQLQHLQPLDNSPTRRPSPLARRLPIHQAPLPILAQALPLENVELLRTKQLLRIRADTKRPWTN
jgi:hypothetical protein